MTMRSEALWSAEKLATLLQQARGTSAQRWRWERDASTLALHPRETTFADPLPRRDLLDCGEVLHLVRTAVVDEGWEVTTTLRGDLDDGPAATVEIVTERVFDDRDDLFSATHGELTDIDLSGTTAVNPDVAMILLRDAAVEHGTRLLDVLDTSAAAAREVTWQTVAVGRIPEDSGGGGDPGAASVALLSIEDDTAAAHLRAGMASADIQLTAAGVGLEAVPLSESETGDLAGSTVGTVPVAFRFGRPRGPSSGHPGLGTGVDAVRDMHAPAGIPLQAATEQRAVRIDQVAAGRHRR